MWPKRAGQHDYTIMKKELEDDLILGISLLLDNLTLEDDVSILSGNKLTVISYESKEEVAKQIFKFVKEKLLCAESSAG